MNKSKVDNDAFLQQESLLKKRKEILHCGFLIFLLVLEQTLFHGWFYQGMQYLLGPLVLFLGYLRSVS
jgi:hypothetical protein